MSTFISNYYADNREWIVFVSKWFLLAACIGAITFFIKPDLIDQIINIFESKFGPQPTPDINLAKEIFIQNATASLIALAGGILFGISAFFIVFFNGFIIGFVILTLLFLPGNPLRNLEYIILGLAPHGIFEIPAFLLAAAVGMRLGTEWIKRDSIEHRWGIFKQNLKRAVYALPIILVLLLIAALVEVFISGRFVDKF